MTFQESEKMGIAFDFYLTEVLHGCKMIIKTKFEVYTHLEV